MECGKFISTDDKPIIWRRVHPCPDLKPSDQIFKSLVIEAYESARKRFFQYIRLAIADSSESAALR